MTHWKVERSYFSSQFSMEMGMVLVIAHTISQRPERIATRAIILPWSACLDRCAEDVRIQALVIPKLKLVDVEMQILLLTLWNVTTIPRFTMDQNPSMVLV